MAKAKNRLDGVLEDTRELEDFLHALLPSLDEQKLRQGEDVLGYAKKRKLKIPESLRGMDVTWETDHSDARGKRGDDTLVLTRAGHAEALGLVIKCVKIGKWRFCLECGFFYCKIVVTRKF